jgi:hypothetical protein
MGCVDRRRYHGGDVSPRPFHVDVSAAFLPEAVTHYEDLESRHLLHRFVLHHRSSQAFALNLFAPLDAAGMTSALALAGFADATETTIEFEYSDDLDRLQEARKSSPHRTQVDVVLRGTTPGGVRAVVLIEVKLTEIDFGWCSAYENPANPARDVCCSPGLFGGDVEGCFQLSSHGTGRRRYDYYLREASFVAPTGIADAGGCAVRGGRNQPMRNLALAHVLLEEGLADHVAYVLCAPRQHRTMWRRFKEVRDAFPDTATRTSVAVTAEDVAALHPDGGSALRAKYPVLVS